MISREDFQTGMELLGVTQKDFAKVKTAKSYAEACSILNSLKTVVKKHFRRLALQLHPDRTGNDPEKMVLFKIASSTVDKLSQMKIKEIAKIRRKGGGVRIIGQRKGDLWRNESFWD